MAGIFKGSVFKNTVFDTAGSLFAVFKNTVYKSTVYLTDGPSPTPDESFGGGFADPKKYREYLERLNGIKRKEIVSPQEIAEIQEIAQLVEIEISEEMINQEIARIMAKINFLSQEHEKQKKRNEEAAFVLMMAI